MNQKLENRGDLLLQKWLNGSITWQEERELEQLAKGDALLADALSGYRLMPESDHTKKIAGFNARLKALMPDKHRTILANFARVAAAAAVVGALALGIWFLNERKKVQPSIADQVSPERSTERPTVNKDSQNIAAPLVAITEEEKIFTSEAPNAKPKANVKVEVPADDTSAEMGDTSKNENQPITIAAAEETPTMDVPKTESAKPIAGYETQKKDNTLTRSMSPAAAADAQLIRGKVTDEFGAPIMGGAVVVKGASIGSITDNNGNFSLKVPRQLNELMFSYSGFAAQTVTIDNKDSLLVILRKNELSNPAYLNSAIAKKELQQTATMPMPRGGFEKLKNYLQKKLKYPKAAQEAGIEGRVVVAFTIQVNGSLSDFNVVESLGYGCDEEAIRLLKAGPKWEMRNKVLQSDTATYTVEFKLK